MLSHTERLLEPIHLVVVLPSQKRPHIPRQYQNLPPPSRPLRLPVQRTAASCKGGRGVQVHRLVENPRQDPFHIFRGCRSLARKRGRRHCGERARAAAAWRQRKWFGFAIPLIFCVGLTADICLVDLPTYVVFFVRF